MSSEVRGRVVEELKCWRCPAKLLDVAGPGTRVRCRRCGAITLVPGEPVAAPCGHERRSGGYCGRPPGHSGRHGDWVLTGSPTRV